MQFSISRGYVSAQVGDADTADPTTIARAADDARILDQQTLGVGGLRGEQVTAESRQSGVGSEFRLIDCACRAPRSGVDALHPAQGPD